MEQVDVAPLETEQLAPPQPTECGEQDEGPVPRLPSAACAFTCFRVGNGRSSAGSTPAPLIVHGLATMRPSSTGVVRMVRRSR
jgi:hypothetical protein